MKKEQVPLCNENDEVIGSIDKNYLHQFVASGKIKPFHRSVQIFILNSKMELLVHKTSLSKGKDKGNKWTVSASGHVMAGENYEDGAVREVKEETSIKIKKKDLRVLTTFKGGDYSGWEHAMVYYVITNKKPIMNAEASDWFFAPLKDVKEKLDKKELPFSKVFKALFKLLWARMSKAGEMVKR
jgi:isopentenyldiphosphate isomerase